MIPVFQILIKMTTILLQLYIKSINILVVSIPIPRNTCLRLSRQPEASWKSNHVVAILRVPYDG